MADLKDESIMEEAYLIYLLFLKTNPIEIFIMIFSMVALIFSFDMMSSDSFYEVMCGEGEDSNMNSMLLQFLTVMVTLVSLLTLFETSSPLLWRAILTVSWTSMGTFASSNLLHFYIWFEFSVLPILVIIMGWGYQPERKLASMHLIMYTLLGSLPLLFIIIQFQSTMCSLDFFILNFSLPFCCVNSFHMTLFSLCLMLGFLVKTPMFMFHHWLIKAHVEAPVVGSMLLAGVMLKLGGCGLFSIKSFFDSIFPSMAVFSISMTGLVVAALICLKITDMKAIIAMTSVIHMAMSLCVMTSNLESSNIIFIIILLNHGISSSYMFFTLDTIVKRSNTRSVIVNMFVMNWSLSLIMFWVMMCAGLLACPPSPDFMGEMMSIISLMKYSSVSFMVILLSGLVSSMYMTSMVFSLFKFSRLESQSTVWVTPLEALNCYVHLGFMLVAWGLISMMIFF